MPEILLNLSAWVERRKADAGPYGEHIIHSVKAYEAEIQRLRDNEKSLRERLADPNAVHINMLRGVIAKPTIAQIRHLYGEELSHTETSN